MIVLNYERIFFTFEKKSKMCEGIYFSSGLLVTCVRRIFINKRE